MSDLHPRQSTDGPSDILLIAENPADHRLLEAAFETTDCEPSIHVVEDGEAALVFQTRGDVGQSASLPDLVILDLNLPEKEEYDVLTTIRDSTTLQCLPMILLTTSEASREIAECLGVHVNAYLPKPTDPDEYAAVGEAVEEFWFDQVRVPPLTP